MTSDEKRTMLSDFCSETDCKVCPLNNKKWSIVLPMGCLDIFDSPEEDLDRAIAIINGVESASDPVNKPSHYTDGKIEVIDFIEDKKLGFCLGNAIKYIARAGKKDPTKEVEDLKKARWYIERRIKEIEEGII